MDERDLVIILSDIHMGTNAPIARYRKEVHEKYLIVVLDRIVSCADQVREMILLGDIFELGSYHPAECPPALDDIIEANSDILGPNGKLRQVLSALEGRIVYIPGDHDKNLTLADINKIKSSDGYTMKCHSGAYIPYYDTGILFTYSHELNLLNASLAGSIIDTVVIGHKHESVKKFNSDKIKYYTTGSLCPAVSDLQSEPMTYGMYSISNRNYRLLKIADLMTAHIESGANAIHANQTTMIPNSDNRLTFGFSVFDASLEFWQMMQMGVLSKAMELGINVITHDQKSSTIEMIIGNIDLINMGIDALLVAPYNPEGLPLIVAAASRSNIPVVALDIGTGGADVAAFIVSDSFGGGIYAGEYALTLVEKYSLQSRNTAIIKVQETAKYALLRGEGFKRVMLENGYQVVAEIPAESQENLGYQVMKNILVIYGDDLAVVFSENGTMALGAARAIDEAGKKGKIMLIGFDSGPSIIAAIKSGSMQGTIAQEPFLIGETAVEVANSVLLGIPVIYDDPKEKIILMEVYLINENGEAIRSVR